MPKKFSLLWKFRVADCAPETGNAKAMAAKWIACPSTIRKWRKLYVNTKARASESSNKLTLDPGAKAQMIGLDTQQ